MCVQNTVHCVAGPSYSVDSACASSSYAFEQAYRAIRSGCCDAAIVAGSQLCLHPYMSLKFSYLGVLSPEACCRTFDRDGKHSSAVRFSTCLYLSVPLQFLIFWGWQCVPCMYLLVTFVISGSATDLRRSFYQY
jgi:hypothetical protein